MPEMGGLRVLHKLSNWLMYTKTQSRVRPPKPNANMISLRLATDPQMMGEFGLPPMQVFGQLDLFMTTGYIEYCY